MEILDPCRLGKLAVVVLMVFLDHFQDKFRVCGVAMIFLQESEIIEILFLEFSVAESSDWRNKMWWEYGIFFLFTDLGAGLQ